MDAGTVPGQDGVAVGPYGRCKMSSGWELRSWMSSLSQSSNRSLRISC